MIGFHHILIHFPQALWTLAFLFILLRFFSQGDLARSAERLLLPVLVLGAGFGILAVVSGLLIWPHDTAISTPLGRNKIAMAFWTTAFWCVLAAYVWKVGADIWTGTNRVIAVGMGLIGTAMAAVTGTLGGHLAGNPTPVSGVLRALNWEIYSTVYVPTSTVALMFGAALALVAIGVIGRRAS